MNKLDLSEQLAEEFGITKKMSEQIVNRFLATIEGEVAKGGRVKLSGFGTFTMGERSKRNGINPNTKEKIVIPGMKTIRFIAGNQFKDKIRKKKA